LSNNKFSEAKFLKQIDKLEMALQALEYERDGQNSKSLNEFWENSEKYLSGKELDPYFKELQKMRSELNA
jgi:5'-deoxynucleotidase YfbR-like HD superfamily hydrolase